jgi:hypothetical protein
LATILQETKKMDYQLNNENLLNIINLDCVPNDEALLFDIEECEISIRKAYLNKDKEESGNTIYISKENLGICIIADDKTPYVMYNENDTTFAPLYDTSPKYIIEFVNYIWPKIMIDMQEREYAWNGVGNELTFENFKSQFGIYNVPKDLKMLFDFENEYGAESFSECFYLYEYDKSGLNSWCDKQEFLDSFIEFATANGSGSSYAYWVVENDIEKCPIVVFGDEGGIHVVANSTKDLIHLLTYDIEIMVDHEEATFYKDKDEYEKSENKREFVKWAKEKFDLKAIKKDEETEKIIAIAKDKYQDKLNMFLISFGIELKK